MDTKLIFIAGIHGVGKSTFCNNLQSQYPNLKCFSASKLIKNYKPNAFTESKQVSDIDGNQDILIKALKSQETSKDLILLDGHFCLFDSDFIPQKISQDVFLKLNMDIIILLTAPVEIIIERMKNRDDKLHSAGSFTALQTLEMTAAKDIAENLNIPLFILTHQEISINSENIISEILRTIK